MTRASPPGNELFITRKRGLARVVGRKRYSSDRSNPSVSLAKLEESEQEHLQEQRRELIRATIANHAFETLLQPIVDLRSGGAVGVEALARFAHRPIRPPDVWFDEAAILGLGVELEMAALHVALEQLRRLPSGLYLSLNASVETIMSEKFQTSMEDVSAERIVLELTEHHEVHDYSLFEQAVRNLRSKGVRLAVDDAGSGYSSFRHILNLHPDIIKLDIGLIRGIDGDPARRALGSALLTFGLDAYNASIVAEGIETEGEFRTLRGLGCPFGQGYYLGRPGRLRAPRPVTSQPLWHPELLGPGPSQVPDQMAPDPEAASPERRQSHETDSQPPPSGNGGGQARSEENHGLLRKKDRHDDYEAMLALMAEIQNVQQNGDERPLQTAL
jgi:EAL domain-containing protein (putative c-di-GMP-specific phosphodiesterase class I)